MSFVSAQHSASAAPVEPLDAAKLSGDIGQLAQAFLAGRLSKAVAITRQLAGQTLERIGETGAG
jgi:hypothetical protein